MTAELDPTTGAIPDHVDCPRVIVEGFAEKGGEVTVSTARPLAMGPYSGEGFLCPHGTAYWVEPTGDQIAQWAKDGVA